MQASLMKSPRMREMRADPHIVKNGKPVEERQVLEGTADTSVDDSMCRTSKKRLPLENYVARVRAAESAQAIEQCGFPGTVWPYQAQNCSRIHIEAYAVERNDTFELNADVADFQNLGLQDGLSTSGIVNGRNAGQAA
jgi:hypothetical protein